MAKLVFAFLVASVYNRAHAFEIVPSGVEQKQFPLRGLSGNPKNGFITQRKEDIDFAGASTPTSLRVVVAALAAAASMVAVTTRRARKPVVGGNWKCNPSSMKDLDRLLSNVEACDTSKCDVYFCPSPLHVDYCNGKVGNGATLTPQNCNFKGCGAYTGEMSVEQMKDMGITQVLVGHSERRGEFGIFPMDDDTTLATKLKYILDAGMSCVYCIGEPKEVREKGIDAVLSLMDKQLEQIYSLLDPEKVVIAYEPVWAIGTGLTATPEDAQETHAGIRKLIATKASEKVAGAIRIQYGGSSNAANAPELSKQPDIDGFLVGGASLKPEFKDMVAAISEAKA